MAGILVSICIISFAPPAAILAACRSTDYVQCTLMYNVFNGTTLQYLPELRQVSSNDHL